MDYLRLVPTPTRSHLIVSRVSDDDEPRELMRLTIDSPEDLEQETLRLVRWALQMQVGIEVPFTEEMVTSHEP